MPLDGVNVQRGICPACMRSMDLCSVDQFLRLSLRDEAPAMGVYAGRLAALLVSFKKGRKPAAGVYIGEIMADFFAAYICSMIETAKSTVSGHELLSWTEDSGEIYISWPAGSRKSVMARGYDHMQRICTVLSRRLNAMSSRYNSARCCGSESEVKRLKANMPGSRVCFVSLPLFKRRGILEQKKLNRQERILNASTLFALKGPALKRLKPGRPVFIVDDVRTTGATLKSCTDLLRRVCPDRPVYPMSFVRD